jgi:hypothetical protein
MTPCSVDDCPNEANRGGRCWAHAKRKARGQDANTLARPSGLERLREAALRYADAEDDEDFRRAEDNLRKAAYAIARRANGGGRPAKVQVDTALAALRAVGSLRGAAALLGCSHVAVWRALRRRQDALGAVTEPVS